MNRKILFHGKRVDNGEWVEGYYVCVGGKHHYILTGKLDITRGYPQYVHYLVIPETVGQYTGLDDKNSTKIFEGDIVKHNNTVYEIAYITQYARFAGRKPKTIMSIFALETSEVIGNIHDNPEFMEVAE